MPLDQRRAAVQELAAKAQSVGLSAPNLQQYLREVSRPPPTPESIPPFNVTKIGIFGNMMRLTPETEAAHRHYDLPLPYWDNWNQQYFFPKNYYAYRDRYETHTRVITSQRHAENVRRHMNYINSLPVPPEAETLIQRYNEHVDRTERRPLVVFQPEEKRPTVSVEVQTERRVDPRVLSQRKPSVDFAVQARRPSADLGVQTVRKPRADPIVRFGRLFKRKLAGARSPVPQYSPDMFAGILGRKE
jgi:hypothetical protein